MAGQAPCGSLSGAYPRVVDEAVTEELGERPELSEEEEEEGEEGEEVVEAGGEEGALWRAIARLGESIRR